MARFKKAKMKCHCGRDAKYRDPNEYSRVYCYIHAPPRKMIVLTKDGWQSEL